MSSSHGRRLPARQRGIAIAVVLLILMILAVLASAAASLGVLNMRQVKVQQDRTVVTHIANGGLHELMDWMNSNPTAPSPTGIQTGSLTTELTRAEYWWTFDVAAEPYCTNNLTGDTAVTGWGGILVPPFSALLIVSAHPDGYRPEAADAVRVAALVADRFPYAILADGTITVDDINGVNGLLGNARSNVTTNTVAITAETVTGHLFTRGGETNVAIDGYPKGVAHYEQPELQIPQLDLSSIIASYGPAGSNPADRTFAGGQTGSTRGGQLFIGNTPIPLPPQGGYTTVYVGGDLRFNGSADLPRGYRVFVDGDINFNGQLNVVTSTAADTFLVSTGEIRFNGLQSTTNIHLFAEEAIRQNGGGDATSFLGLLYIEDGRHPALDFNGNGVYRGTAMVRGDGVGAIVDAPNADFAFDPSVLKALDFFGFSLDTIERLTILSWWVVD
ncbi:MAG: hypothetical protein HY319_29970 [Armatimonadetes bacterium]|nr:hypothetical protein [Armatimonadota bacterium]